MNDSNNMLNNDDTMQSTTTDDAGYPIPKKIDSINSDTEINSMPSNQQVQNTINNTYQNVNNTEFNNQNATQLNDEGLLRAFIGQNYEKITTKKFNFAAFFFNSLYMCYRKMFGYGILTFLVYLIVYGVINAFIPTLSGFLIFGLWVLIGLFTNKIYLSFARKKIGIIKATNPEKNNEELKMICAIKGGTSVGKVFLGFFIQFVISFVILIIVALIGIGSLFGEIFDISGWNIFTNNGNNVSNENINSKDKQLLENVTVGGYASFGSKYNVSINDSNGNSENYDLNVSNKDLFVELGNYKDYIKLDIYYVQNGTTKSIVDYKIFLKSNNEDITVVKDINELRDKVGLYSQGTHTDTLTLIEIGMQGFGYIDDESYTYNSYIFADSHNNEYEMKYINDDGSKKLVKGNKYTVTFEVVEGAFDYEYTIKSIN